jgi:EAL domain-containing protein (putative c-di-GMP-specific phosphodiesterase class I)/GGDEF domain-containing protein
MNESLNKDKPDNTPDPNPDPDPDAVAADTESRDDSQIERPEPLSGGAVLGNVFAPPGSVQVRRVHLDVDRGRAESFREKADEIHRMLLSNRSLALLYVDASSLAHIEQDYGVDIYDRVREILANLIMDMRGTETRGEDLVTVNEDHGDTFLIFLTGKREERPFGQGDLEAMADRIHEHLTRRLARMTSSYLKRCPKLGVGYGLVLHNPLIKDDRLILRLIDDARRMAEFQEYRLRTKSKELLQELILKEDIRTLFQPIVSLGARTTLGYEGLSRGPEGTEYESPYMLFDVATDSDLLFELDRLCRRKTLVAAQKIDPKSKIFINLLPMTMRDPEFQGERMLDFLAEQQLEPSRIVFEITERLAIQNYDLFLEAMETFTDMGFEMAIDDMGAGYSGLEKIVRLRPRYLKFDSLMVRDIHTSFVKREMLKAIQTLAMNVGADVIAEGVERTEELETLMELGIAYGQGYLFAKPAPEPIAPPKRRTVTDIPGLIVD